MANLILAQGGAPIGGVSGAMKGRFLPGSGHVPSAFKVMRPWLSQGKNTLANGRLGADARDRHRCRNCPLNCGGPSRCPRLNARLSLRTLRAMIAINSSSVISCTDRGDTVVLSA